VGLWVIPGKGTFITGQVQIRARDSLYQATFVKSPDSVVLVRGRATVPLGVNSAAVVVFDSSLLRLAATDTTLGGGYDIILTSLSPEAVWWDESASTPAQFIVRSVRGHEAPFTYIVVASSLK
jgi:hypothetical protein